MSWFDSSFSFAKTAFSQAQKSIDRVLDINETKEEEGEDNEQTTVSETKTKEASLPMSKTASDGFSSTWGSLDSFWTAKDSSSSKTQESTNRESITPQKKLRPATKPVNRTGKTGSAKTTPTKVTKSVSTPSAKSDSSFINHPTLTSTPVSDPSSPKYSTPASDPSLLNTRVSEPSLKPASDPLETTHVSEPLIQKHLSDPSQKILEDDKETESSEVSRPSPTNQDEPAILEMYTSEETDSCKVELGDQSQDKELVSHVVEPVKEVQDLIEKPVSQVTAKPVDQVLQPVDQVTAEPVSHAVSQAVKPVGQVTEPVEEAVGQKGKSSVHKEAPSTVETTAVLKRQTTNEGSVQDSSEIKSTENESETVKQLTLELAQTKQILEARESKLMEISKETISLHESNLDYQRITQETRKELESVKELKEQLSEQVERLEKKLDTLTAERNSLKEQVSLWEKEHTQRRDTTDSKTADLLKEKDEQIAGLMAEGEKLSRQELQFNNTIKKLRAKEKQNEQLVMAQKQQIEDVESEVKRLKEVIKKKEENEKKYQESLSQLNGISEQQAKELTQLKPEKVELQEKVRSLQSNLDSTYKELTELRKANAMTQSAVEEAALFAQQNTRDELRKEAEEQRLQSEKDKDILVMQINELRMTLERTEQQVSWKEEQLRQEITDLHKRLQHSESRNQTLSETISNATRPLLRQIEHLQSVHSTQVSNWEKVETSLTQRIVDSQTQMNAAVEKERTAVEKEALLQGRVSGLENQVQTLRQERAQLIAALETEKTKLQTLEETHQREVSKHNVVRSSLQQTVEDLKSEKERIEHQLDYERVRLEAESRKATLELQEKEKLRNQLALSLTYQPPSISSDIVVESTERSLSQTSEVSLLADNSFRGDPLSSTSVLEHLQSLLKQKEGELSNAQNMMASLERSRSSMTQELASVTERNETLEREVNTIPEIKRQLMDISQKYEALLQMFGEKAEETEELKMDIQDLKAMYRQQIEDLLSRSPRHHY